MPGLFKNARPTQLPNATSLVERGRLTFEPGYPDFPSHRDKHHQRNDEENEGNRHGLDYGERFDPPSQFPNGDPRRTGCKSDPEREW